MEKQGKASALLPIIVFLVLFLGVGGITGDFNNIPAIAAFLVALSVAFLQNRNVGFNDKMKLAAKGVGDENVIIMCLVFLAAGAFSGAVTAAGGRDSTVNFCLSILPPGVAVMGLMLIGCFISLSMGTSMGTISALAPIAVGISEKTGFPMVLCMGAVVSGAMFGDNLSMISDTTIAATRTQGCEMKDKFRENFKIVLPAAIVALVLYGVMTMGRDVVLEESYAYNIFQILPYLVVLIGALAGVNVFIILIGGTILSLIVGVATGTIALPELFVGMGSGINGMYDITVISIVVACIVALVKNNGGIDYLLSFIRRKIKGETGGEFGIAVLTLLVDMATANNTIAIVMAGPIAKEISDEYGISAKRTASLWIFRFCGTGVDPLRRTDPSGSQLHGTFAGGDRSYTFYPMLMGVSALIFIFL